MRNDGLSGINSPNGLDLEDEEKKADDAISNSNQPKAFLKRKTQKTAKFEKLKWKTGSKIDCWKKGGDMTERGDGDMTSRG